MKYELLMERSGPANRYAAAEWEDFLVNTVTPRFPDGFTVLNGGRQCLGESGEIQKEDTKVIVILSP